MSLEVINSPLLATIQDNGRFAYKHLGVTNSGVMDQYAYTMANKLLDNLKDTNTIEIAFGNITFKVNEDTSICITGAESEVFINDTLQPQWKTLEIKKNDIIKIGKILSGVYIYLSVKDGFILQKELGSYSTSIKENIGGAKLQKGDILSFHSSKNFPKKRLQKELIPQYENELILRVIESSQYKSFTNKEEFFNNAYKVSNEINRMGCKLQGKPIHSALDGIISEGITFGAIQIPKDGQPIVLLKEHQTIGGYPKIGVVLDVDCFKLAQVKPNTTVRFQKISMEEATKISKMFYSI